MSASLRWKRSVFDDHLRGFEVLDWEAPSGRTGLLTCPCVLRAVVSPKGSASIQFGELPVARALADGRLAVVPARLPAEDHRKVIDVLTESAHWLGASRKSARRALDDLDAEHLAPRSFGRLSSFEQRLISLAHGLLSKPQMLVLPDWFHFATDEDQRQLGEKLLAWKGAWLATIPPASPALEAVRQTCDALVAWDGNTLKGQGDDLRHFWLQPREGERGRWETLRERGMSIRPSTHPSWYLATHISRQELESTLERAELTPETIVPADAGGDHYCLAQETPELVWAPTTE